MSLNMIENKGVIVIASCPSIEVLHSMILSELFPDQLTDKIMNEKVSRVMEELILTFIEQPDTFDSMYNVVIEDILLQLAHYVLVFNIKALSYYCQDTLLIHCSRLDKVEISTF